MYHELATAVFLHLWLASGGAAKLVTASDRLENIFEALGPYPSVADGAIDFDIGILIKNDNNFDPALYVVDPISRPTPAWPASIDYLGFQVHIQTTQSK